MYTPRAFAVNDPAALDALFARDPFVTLITVADGEPRITHLPVLYRRVGDDILIEGHWARPNPQAGTSGQATMIVHGPHAYVSPSWYADKAEQVRVPTWDYATAHLHGELEAITDEATLLDIVGRLATHFESTVGGDWRLDPDNPAERVQIRGIIGLRFRPRRIEITHKLNQNHPEANRRGVAARLAVSPLEREREIGAMMFATLDTPSQET
ncbi:MAG: FMN-binding negative transcriptional regulator [Xanthomonadales bacterium]|nr:FMN-binding negative transcriptional regulator [Xanthomonadales bacterium]